MKHTDELLESFRKKFEECECLLNVATGTSSLDTPEERRAVIDDISDAKEIAELRRKIDVIEARRMYRRERKLSARIPEYDKSAVEELVTSMSQDELREVLDDMPIEKIMALQAYINQEYEKDVENRRTHILQFIDRVMEHNDNKSIT